MENARKEKTGKCKKWKMRGMENGRKYDFCRYGTLSKMAL